MTEEHRKKWPFTSATSISRIAPWASASAASARSSGMPRSLASMFMVPSGRMPSAAGPPISRAAAAAMVPSPPPTTTASAPCATA